ncbi:hypothetical protein A3J41_02935 [candidate division TM6 bacterium RIFCSPHIGHO2_12_FULL_38_8]|nr:MAG: hypothetical protein A3J41_02935 [candidate division TM6 bacterium RIFCSPHIGHO2_12_FULL_38_8]
MKLILKSLIITTFFLYVQSLHGSFKQNLIKNPVKISVQTSQFLKHIMTLQHDFLERSSLCNQSDSRCIACVQSMQQCNAVIVGAGEITPAMMNNMFAIMQKAKNIAARIKSSAYCVSKNQAFRIWWEALEHALKFVQVRGYEKDVAWLKVQIASQSIVYAMSLCIDLMQHFNGMMVSVTEYDLLVLANLVVVLLAMGC